MEDIIQADVIVGGVICDCLPEDRYIVRTKTGTCFIIRKEDIKSYRPKVKEVTEDKRKGN